ncbi:MAG: GspH/FimT family pseudopilin [Pseudomonadota bacterium]
MRGYTIIELLTVLAMMALLISYAPGITQTWVAHHRMQTQRATFLSAINTARTSAIFHNRAVTVCPATVSGCGPRDAWHAGTLVFFDTNGNRRVDGGEKIITRVAKLQHARVRWRSFRNRTYLKFTGRGLTDWQNGHFLFCHRNGDPRLARSVTLNYAGRTYPSFDRDGDGVHENAQGVALRC